jgi:hypothetical protein
MKGNSKNNSNNDGNSKNNSNRNRICGDCYKEEISNEGKRQLCETLTKSLLTTIYLFQWASNSLTYKEWNGVKASVMELEFVWFAWILKAEN